MSLVLRTFPVHLSQKVDLDSDIEVTFLFDIFKESINTNNVMLLNLKTQKGEEISVVYKDKLLKILPARRLEPLTHYQVELVGGVEGGIRDITERPLLQSYKFEFVTGNETRMARPLITSPTDLSEITGDAKFTWLPVDRADHYELEISKSNTFDVLVWPHQNTGLIFDTQVVPDIDYQKGITYYARIRAVNIQGVKSAYSNPIRYHYDGIDETEPPPEKETINIDHVKTLQAEGGEVLFRMDKPYTPGIGQLSVYLNGMKLQPCSGPTVTDGDYREVDQYFMMFVEPLQAEDAIEFRIANAVKQDVLVGRETTPASEIDTLRDYFAAQLEELAPVLAVSSVKPKNGSLMVTDLSSIIIEFSQEVDPKSIDEETVYVVSEKN
ncbi:hypothetical protein TCA2_4532 [Paenibacillus sp. TCA20]|uniref:Ig-like domain-containing protein n=1 Tax=Paenibacillus sp. TCA20 TaxID=1499968 RepID=UPI0004D34C28|nr:Ig-like domain-containing protein [Paenibacillus sp. TCA20]GAK42040.1 hypothetical protein TCA2_4532 [Paenibacillus sp. TCA20]